MTQRIGKPSNQQKDWTYLWRKHCADVSAHYRDLGVE